MVRTFLFVAGAAVLDFLNTEIVMDGQPVDLLADEDDLLRWLAESRLASAPEVRSMKGRWLREAKALRAALRRMFLRLAAGEALRPSDLAPLNETLKKVRSHPELRLLDGRPHIETKTGGGAGAP